MKRKPITLKIALLFLALQFANINDFAQSKPFKDRIVDSIAQFVLPSEFLYGVNEWLIGDACSDIAEVGGNWPIDADDAQQMSIFNFNTAGLTIFTYYRWNYFGIGLCNQYLKIIGNNPLAETIQKQRAEVLFYRSLFYYNLVRLFGDVAIYNENDISKIDSSGTGTIYNHYLPAIQSDTIHKARANAADVWSMIEADLGLAIQYLPQNSALSSPRLYSVTKGAALTLMAKVKLYEKKWDDALGYLNQIINSGEYTLEDKFDSCFTTTKHGKESIFELEQYGLSFAQENSLPEPNPPYAYSFVHNMFYNPRHVVLSNFNGTKNYVSSHNGWGFNCPKKAYVESFLPGDPRKKSTIISQDDSILWSAYSGNDTVWAIMDPMNNWSESTPAFPDEGSPTGFYSRKYFISAKDVPLFDIYPRYTGGYKNIRVFRYADVLLMAAEAEYQLGKSDSALFFVNLIRLRARNSGKTGLPVNLTSITLDSIYNERKWEFGGEGHQLFDLLRTGKAYQAIEGTYSSTFNTTIHFDSTKYNLFPIPLQDLAMSKGVLTQNPGYKTADTIYAIRKTNPFENITVSVDTVRYNSSNFVYNSSKDLLNNHFEIDSLIQLQINPVFYMKSKATLGSFIPNIEYPDINGDVEPTIYAYSFQYILYTDTTPSGQKVNISYPFTDTVIVSAYNFVETVYDTFTITFVPKEIVSIEESRIEPMLKIIPNPATRIINIQLSEIPKSDYDLQIYSINGVIMLSTIINSQSTTIDVSMLPPGFYFARIPQISCAKELLIIR